MSTATRKATPGYHGLFKAFLVAGTTVLAGWIGWNILEKYQALDTAKPPTPTGSWRVGNVARNIQTARTALAAGDLETARTAIEHALQISPLSVEALGVLAQISTRSGDMAHGQEIERMIFDMTRRDRNAVLAMLEITIANGDRAELLRVIDIMMRTLPSSTNGNDVAKIHAFIADLLKDPDLRAGLIDYLAAAPNWRDPFLAYLSWTRAPAFPDYMIALANSDSPPPRTLWEPYLRAEIDTWEARRAYQLWQGIQPPGGAEAGNHVFDGRFNLPAGDLPFEWRFQPIRGAHISQSTRNGDRALSVEFSGARVPFANVNQEIILSPGSYTLSGSVESDELTSPVGLNWKIYCISGHARQLIATTERFSGTIKTHTFSVDFDIPGENCGSQDLRLESAAKVVAEQAISGQIWFDNLKISSQQ